MKQQSAQIKEQLLKYEGPRWQQFPMVDLYMDQMISLLTNWIAPLYFDQDKDPVTASMVNNYVKNSIVKPPVKKHYKDYHLGYLYVVLLLKQCFSLSEISRLIQIYSDIENPQRIAQDFNRFVYIFEDSLHEILQTGTCTKHYFENPTWQQQLMVNSIRTVVYRIYSICESLSTHEQDKENEE